MNYTEYVTKIITKAAGGKVLFKKKDELLVQGVIVLDGTTDKIQSKLNSLDKQLVNAHKAWLTKLIKRYPELSEIFTKDTINSIEYQSDYDLNYHNSDQDWAGESTHFTKWVSVYSEEQMSEYDYSLVPTLCVGIACQDYYTQYWEDEPVTTIYFQVELSTIDSFELVDWLKDKGVSADIFSI